MNGIADWLRSEMAYAKWNVHTVGDVNGTNSILDAIHSAANLGRTI